MHLQQPLAHARHAKLIRVTYISILLLLIGISIVSVTIIYTKQLAFDLLWYESPVTQTGNYTLEPFPVGVNPSEKIITENTDVQTYLHDRLSYNTPKPLPQKKNWLRYSIAKLAQLDWYQNLASPTGRILVVSNGARKEEVTNNFAQILKWDDEMQQTFQALVVSSPPAMSDGKFFPAHYLVGKEASPEEVADILINRFNSEIATRYSFEVSQVVSMEDALTIASLLEREAYDFTDMRIISGVIWNRLFIDMKLQIDATLQYAKGTDHSSTWYPPVKPEDKYIDSPFNTYQNKGLPPAPIGNPSTAAVLAALNPTDTDCIFYFHDKNSQFHCSPTYEGHVDLLKQYYGQGK